MTYADFIRSLPCSVCGDDTTVEQHHLIDLELVEKGMGRKVDEILSIPLCNNHHRILHHDLGEFEHYCGTQEAHLCKTLLLALNEGAITRWP